MNEKINLDINEDDSESLTRVLDTFLTVAKLKNKSLSVVFFVLKSIKRNNTHFSSIDSELISECQLVGTVLQLETQNDNFFFVSGKYGDKIECNGDLCVQIATKSIVINNEHKNAFPVAQMVEGIALLRDLYKNNENLNLKTINNPFLSDSISTIFEIKKSLSVDELYKCKICKKKFEKERMRQHIGKHIISNDITNHSKLCGFCGQVGCHIAILTYIINIYYYTNI